MLKESQAAHVAKGDKRAIKQRARSPRRIHPLDSSCLTASMFRPYLPQVLQQIQAQVVSSQRQLGMVRVQVQGREREKRMHELTLKQLQEVQPDTNLYRGVGKMCVYVCFRTGCARVYPLRFLYLSSPSCSGMNRLC